MSRCSFYNQCLCQGPDSLAKALAKMEVVIDASTLFEQIEAHPSSEFDIVPPASTFWIEMLIPKGQCPALRIGIMTQVFEDKESDNRQFASRVIWQGEKLSTLAPSDDKAMVFETNLKGELLEAYKGSEGLIKTGHLVPNPQFGSLIYESKVLRFVCSFMSAKNVSLQSQPVQFREREKRILRKRNISSEIRYHEIVVRRIGKRGETNIAADGHEMPLHLCRGHLRKYSPERPLFGLHSGTFYIHSHVRGNAKNGQIQKTYRLCD